MRKVAFVVFLVGILCLIFLFELPSVRVDRYSDLEGLEVNRKVLLKGEVESERFISNGRVLLRVRGIDIVCECDGDFAGKEVEIEGIVIDYEGKREVEVLRVRIGE